MITRHCRLAAIAMLLALVLNACAGFEVNSPTPQSSENIERAGEVRKNLLVSLKHDRRYGIIRYGEIELLYRDLTVRHPSSRDIPEVINESPPLAENRTLAVLRSDSLAAKVNLYDTHALINAQATARSEQALSDALAKTPIDVTEYASATETDVCHGATGYVRAADEMWLSTQPSYRWTIQILSRSDALEPCVDDDYLKSIEARRYSVFHDNAIWHVAIVGEYESADEALAAATAYESPWVRQIGALRSRRCNSVAYMPAFIKSRITPWCQSRGGREGLAISAAISPQGENRFAVNDDRHNPYGNHQ